MNSLQYPPQLKKLVLVIMLCLGSLQAHSKKPNKLFKPGPSNDTIASESFYDKSLLTGPFSSWGINPLFDKSNINLAKAWQIFKPKRKIVVAVVDTGIDPNHSFLANNIIRKCQEAVTKVCASFGFDFAKKSKFKDQPFDSHGHGTHVTGIVKSVYPDVEILSLKYYNPNASGQDNLNSTIKALEHAVEAGVDIINYSGGGPEPAAEEKRVLKKALDKGILVIAAAGNERSNIDNIQQNGYFPASYGFKNILTVTAHNKELNILTSSNWGKRSVDISAPGHRIRSAIPKGPNGSNRSGYMTGTSQATAFVTGVAALVMANFPELDIYQVKRIIKSSASITSSLTGKCNSDSSGLGNCGRLNAYKALVYANKKSIKEKTRKLANSKKKSK